MRHFSSQPTETWKKRQGTKGLRKTDATQFGYPSYKCRIDQVSKFSNFGTSSDIHPPLLLTWYRGTFCTVFSKLCFHRDAIFAWITMSHFKERLYKMLAQKMQHFVTLWLSCGWALWKMQSTWACRSCSWGHGCYYLGTSWGNNVPCEQFEGMQTPNFHSLDVFLAKIHFNCCSECWLEVSGHLFIRKCSVACGKFLWSLFVRVKNCCPRAAVEKRSPACWVYLV